MNRSKLGTVITQLHYDNSTESKQITMPQQRCACVRNTDDFSSPRGNNAISCFHCSHIQISCFSPDEVTCSVANLISQTPCYLWVPDGRSYCIVLSHLYFRCSTRHFFVRRAGVAELASHSSSLWTTKVIFRTAPSSSLNTF